MNNLVSYMFGIRSCFGLSSYPHYIAFTTVTRFPKTNDLAGKSKEYRSPVNHAFFDTLGANIGRVFTPQSVFKF